jgi:carboxypeptidase family protein
MRVVADSRHLAVEPGRTTAVVLDVVNTEDVIDGVSANVIGIPTECVSAQPALLPLFPDAAGTVTLELSVPSTHPAGRHPLTIEVVSHGTMRAPQYLDVDLDVTARPGMRLDAQPKLVRARRSGRYVLELANYGNVPLDVTLSASDPDRNVQVTFTPERRTVEPGAVAPVMLVLRGPRMFTGAEVDRAVTVEANAQPFTAPTPALTPAPAPDNSPPDNTTPGTTAPLGPGADGGTDESDAFDGPAAVVCEIPLVFRQRPLIGRGLLTAGILVTIVAAWAAIFLIGLSKVFANDPMTKEAPASFFVSKQSTSASGNQALAAATRQEGAAAAPAGALSKSGQLPAGLGGTVNGTVVAAYDSQPVGRILVRAYRAGPHGLIAMSSTASQADGTYSLAGLFPTSYYIEFSATGYRTQWYPNQPSHSRAQPIIAVAQGVTSGIDARIAGERASISGTINAGDTLRPVITTVTARPLLGPQTGQAVASTKTQPNGAYRLTGLPAPETYELTFTTPGYQASTLVDDVSGGDARLEPTVMLGASTGQISGVVTAGTAPLGGARVSTTVGGTALNVLTPTTGQVGVYALVNLPTPATYVITFSSPGHGTTTQVVDLAAGQSRAGLNVNLASGTGSIKGQVLGPGNTGLGGATVAVGGAVNSSGGTPTATTLTTGIPGSFNINGLAVPGSYTLTVTLTGFAVASVPVELTANAAAPNVVVHLTARLGSVAGTVRGPNGQPFAGATITATNGQKSLSATSESSDGGYLIANLDPGSYSLTVTAPGLRQQTALINVSPGTTTTQNLRLGG